MVNIGNNCSSNYNLLRWLLRRGSPLPIPNREVKPDCADGTAVMWESMSPPFFRESFTKVKDFFVYRYYSYVVPKAFGTIAIGGRRLFLKTLS